MPDPTPIEQLEGVTLEGRFVLERFVARGGYGAVFRGRHLSLGCPVAVKLLDIQRSLGDETQAEFLARFENEARVVAALQHPAIVRVLDSGVTDLNHRRQAFMVLEWIHGETLERVLRGSGEVVRRSPREALELLRPVMDAIAYAHEAGVVHRDLKPDNIMMDASRRDRSTLRLLDFGIAKEVDLDEAPGSGSTRTQDDYSSFSLSHAAPEQIGRLRTGPWTDVHALALLLVEVIVGQRAYRGDSSLALFASISSQVRPTPGTFLASVGPWEAILARALSLVPSERHASAALLWNELEESLGQAERAWEDAQIISHATPLDAPVQAPQVGSNAGALVSPPTLPQRALWFVLALAAVVCLSVVSLRSIGHSPLPEPRRVSAPPTTALTSNTPASNAQTAQHEAPASPSRVPAVRAEAPNRVPATPPARVRAPAPRPRAPAVPDEIVIE